MIAESGFKTGAEIKSSYPARFLLLVFTLAQTSWLFHHSYDRWYNLICSLDYGHIDSASYNTTHGGFMYSHVDFINFWADHFSPILLIKSAFYYFSDAYWFTFLWQSGSIGLAAIPLFLIARHFLKNEWVALLVSTGYLLNGKMQIGALFDYHMISHEALFIFSAFYAMIRKRWGWYFFFGALLTVCKEDAFIIFSMLGFYAAVIEREYKKALYTWGLCGVYALVVFKVAYPMLTDKDKYGYSGQYAWLGGGAFGIAKNFLTRPMEMVRMILAQSPERNAAWMNTLIQFGFLPFLSPTGLALAAPPSMELFLAARSQLFKLTHHYGMYVVPVWTLASVFAMSNIRWVLRKLGAKRETVAVVVAIPAIYMIGINIYMAKDFGALPFISDPSVHIKPEHRRHTEQVREAMKIVPYAASMSSTMGIFTTTHHAPGKYFYRSYKWFPFGAKTIDYIAIDTNGNVEFLRKHNRAQAAELLLHREYGAVAERDGLFIFKRGLDKRKDHELYMDRFTTSSAETMGMAGGENAPDESSPYKISRKASPDRTPRGIIIFGPYLTLRKGGYTALFRMRVAEKTDSGTAMIEVTANQGKQVIAQRTLKGSDFTAAGAWTEFALPFSVDEERLDFVELRVHYLGGAELYTDRTRVEMPYETFMANMRD